VSSSGDWSVHRGGTIHILQTQEISPLHTIYSHNWIAMV
jgi:hypothetical protein